MRYSMSLCAPAIALIMLGACNQEAPVSPRLDAAASRASLGANQVVVSARGSGHFRIAGELRTFSFNASKRADGSVHGSFELQARQSDRMLRGTVTCMTVYGKSAWIGARVTDERGATEDIGRDALFQVVDLPQYPGGSPDLLSLVQVVPAGAAQGYCDATPYFPPLNLTEAGEIVITQPGSMSFTAVADFPIEFSAWVPCAANGAGEVVMLSGTLHDLFHFTDNGAGGYSVMFEDNPQGVTGIGLTTGDKYEATGVSRYSFNVHSLPYETTMINNFRIIGPGPGNNLLEHVNMHLTISATGQITAEVFHGSIECQ